MLNSKVNIAGLRVTEIRIIEEDSTEEGFTSITNASSHYANHAESSHMTSNWSTLSEPNQTEMNENANRMTENRTTHNTENERREKQSENESREIQFENERRHIFDSDTDIVDNQTQRGKLRNYSLMPVDFEEQGEPKVIDIVQRRRDSQIAHTTIRKRIEIEFDGTEMEPKVIDIVQRRRDSQNSHTTNRKREINCPLRMHEGRLRTSDCNSNALGIIPSQIQDEKDSVSLTYVTAVASRRVSVEEPIWRNVGTVMNLSRYNCQRLYSMDGGSLDLALFYNRGQFYAMSAWCGHMGGPLYEGDIEDHKGRAHVMCPWHSYMFDLESGSSDLGLQQKVFPTQIEDNCLHVLYASELSTIRCEDRDDTDPQYIPSQ